MYSQERDLQGRGFINIFSRRRIGFHSWAKSFSQRVNLLSALALMKSLTAYLKIIV